MATAARFGRMPRSSPSLTGTIVALAQQYQAQRDRNIEAAWKNGTQFEGNKVEDKDILKYWNQRLGETSREDPMWDYYNDLIKGLEFNIAESEMGLKYAQEKVSDSQMAKFYMDWANKMPRNSAAYRNLATQAAKFKAAAGARARGGSARAAAAAYANAQQRTHDKNVLPFLAMTNLVSQYALASGILDEKEYAEDDYGWSKLTTASAEHDPSEFTALVTSLMDDPGVRKQFTDIMREYDPGFDGTFDEDSFARLANGAANGLQIMYNRAVKAGHKDEANGYLKDKDNMQAAAFVMVVMKGGQGAEQQGFMEQDVKQRAQFDAVVDDPTSTPLEKAAAGQIYGDWLMNGGGKLYANSFPPGALDPGNPGFNPYAAGYWGLIDNTVQVLNGKMPGGSTTKDGDFGFGKSPEAGATSDAQYLFDLRAKYDADMTNLATGSGIMVQTDGNGKLVADGGVWEVLPRTHPAVQEAGEGLIAVPAPGVTSASAYQIRGPDGQPMVGANGLPVTVGGLKGQSHYVLARPIKIQTFGFQNPQTGELTGEPLKLAPGATDTIGQYFEFMGPNNQIQKAYGVYQNGRLILTKEVPWQIDGAIEKDTADGKIISYADPESAALMASKTSNFAGVDPRLRVNDDAYMNPEHPEWQPGDVQTGWDSPMQMMTTGSDEGMKWASEGGKQAYIQSEVDWFSNSERWTSDMMQKSQQGFKPEEVITGKANESWNRVEAMKIMGFSPETRGQYFKGMQDYARGMQAARGATPEWQAQQGRLQEEQERQAAMARLREWDNAGRSPQRPTGAQMPWGGLTGPVPFGPGPDSSKLPQGWSIEQLLSQPGMSAAQASALVAQITGQGPGARYASPFTNVTQPGASNVITGGGTITGKGTITGGGVVPTAPGYTGSSTRYKNPYMPSPGQLPAQRPAYNPYQGLSAPSVKPKAQPSPTPLFAPGTTEADIEIAKNRPKDYFVELPKTLNRDPTKTTVF